MELKSLYTGLPVTNIKHEGTYEVIRIDDITESIYCRPINSVESGIKEFKAEDLQEYRRS